MMSEGDLLLVGQAPVERFGEGLAIPMVGVPVPLVEGCSPDDRRLTEGWWATLDDAARVDVADLLDPRWESCSFAREQDDSGHWIWRPLSITVNSEWLVDVEEMDVDWAADYFEYMIVHPEIFPRYEMCIRTFYIGG